MNQALDAPLLIITMTVADARVYERIIEQKCVRMGNSKEGMMLARTQGSAWHPPSHPVHRWKARCCLALAAGLLARPRWTQRSGSSAKGQHSMTPQVLPRSLPLKGHLAWQQEVPLAAPHSTRSISVLVTVLVNRQDTSRDTVERLRLAKE